MSKSTEPNPIDVHVGERLRSRRNLLGLSQEKLANAVGITFQQVQRYERGANRVSASRLWQFSKILDAPISYFFANYGDAGKIAKDLPSYGLADNDQDGFEGEKNVMDQKETLDLVREYYSIPDPKLRKDLFKMIKTMAASMRESGK